jgi:hypothetical protein
VQRQQEIEVWTEQIGELQRTANAQRARAAQLAETLVVAQQQVEQVRVELVDLERSIDGVESAQTHLHQDAEAAQSELSRHEVKLAETRSRAQFIAEDMQREFQVSVGSYDWRALLWRADDDPPDLKPLDLDEDEAEGGERKAESGAAAPVAGPPNPFPAPKRRCPGPPIENQKSKIKNSAESRIRPRTTSRRSRPRSGIRSRPRSTRSASGSSAWAR